MGQGATVCGQGGRQSLDIHIRTHEALRDAEQNSGLEGESGQETQGTDLYWGPSRFSAPVEIRRFRKKAASPLAFL